MFCTKRRGYVSLLSYVATGFNCKYLRLFHPNSEHTKISLSCITTSNWIEDEIEVQESLLTEYKPFAAMHSCRMWWYKGVNVFSDLTYNRKISNQTEVSLCTTFPVRCSDSSESPKYLQLLFRSLRRRSLKQHILFRLSWNTEQQFSYISTACTQRKFKLEQESLFGLKLCAAEPWRYVHFIVQREYSCSRLFLTSESEFIGSLLYVETNADVYPPGGLGFTQKAQM